MKKLSELYQKGMEYPILVLIILLPFNGLLSTFFRYKLGFDNFWIYKDILILISIFFGLIIAYKKKELHRLLSTVNILSALFIVWMLLSILWAPDQSVLRFATGIKYSFIFLGAYLAGNLIYLFSNKKLLFIFC